MTMEHRPIPNIFCYFSACTLLPNPIPIWNVFITSKNNNMSYYTHKWRNDRYLLGNSGIFLFHRESPTGIIPIQLSFILKVWVVKLNRSSLGVQEPLWLHSKKSWLLPMEESLEQDINHSVQGIPQKFLYIQYQGKCYLLFEIILVYCIKIKNIV